MCGIYKKNKKKLKKLFEKAKLTSDERDRISTYNQVLTELEDRALNKIFLKMAK